MRILTLVVTAIAGMIGHGIVDDQDGEAGQGIAQVLAGGGVFVGMFMSYLLVFFAGMMAILRVFAPRNSDLEATYRTSLNLFSLFSSSAIGFTVGALIGAMQKLRVNRPT